MSRPVRPTDAPRVVRYIEQGKTTAYELTVRWSETGLFIVTVSAYLTKAVAPHADLLRVASLPVTIEVGQHGARIFSSRRMRDLADRYLARMRDHDFDMDLENAGWEIPT